MNRQILIRVFNVMVARKMDISTIALVPGAFHVASSIDLLSLSLRRWGYDTRRWGLTTVNNPAASVTDDVSHLAQDVLKPLIEVEGKDVVLYLHSYAGFPGSAAIVGFARAERVAVGEKGGIVGLIYQAAFVPKEGISLNGMIGGHYPPWQDPDASSYPHADILNRPVGGCVGRQMMSLMICAIHPGENWARPRQGSKTDFPRRRAGAARDRSRGSHTQPIYACVHDAVWTGALSG